MLGGSKVKSRHTRVYFWRGEGINRGERCAGCLVGSIVGPRWLGVFLQSLARFGGGVPAVAQRIGDMVRLRACTVTPVDVATRLNHEFATTP